MAFRWRREDPHLFCAMRRLLTHSRAGILPASWCFFFATCAPVHAEETIAIGDSLTAEYDTIPDVSGFPREATAYAEVTVDGWESMSWVEILGRLRGDAFDFGRTRELPRIWGVPRMSGYELNWAIPGISASQYEDFVTSSASSNIGYWTARQPLEAQLETRAERVVIWLGTNEFRANYGFLYDGGDSQALIDGLIEDLGQVIDFVQNQNRELQIVVANLPDLGASPAKKAAHPDPERRARVTAATEIANTRIAELAAEKGVAVANVYAQTERLVQGVPTYFGAVEIIDDQDADNDPHYHFTRDGLHPNTPSQIELARIILRTFNIAYGAGIPQITAAEALNLLGIDPREPYFDWLNSYGVTKRGFKADLDGDGLSQLVEYGFDLDPTVSDAAELPVARGGPVLGIPGEISVNYHPDPARARHVRVRVQYSTDQLSWTGVPPENVVANSDGSFTAVIPPLPEEPSLRLKVSIIPPSGSTANFSSIVPIP